MKKTLLTLAIVFGVSLISFAQQVKKDIFSLGINGGIPTGNASDASSFTIGGDIKFDHPVADKVFVTFSAGYTYFPYKSSVTTLYQSIGIHKSGEGFVPLKVGGKYFVDQSFFLEGQVGAAISTEQNGGTGFAYSPGIGFKLTNHADVGVRYEGWTKSGNTISQFGLRLGIIF